MTVISQYLGGEMMLLRQSSDPSQKLLTTFCLQQEGRVSFSKFIFRKKVKNPQSRIFNIYLATISLFSHLMRIGFCAMLFLF